MYTLAQLRELARQRADMENSSFVTEPELTRYVNDAIDELFGLLVTTYGQEYFYASSELTTSEDVAAYSLDAHAFKLLRVDVLTGEGYEPLRPWRFPGATFAVARSRRTGRLPRYRWAGDRLIFEPAPPGTHTFRVHYVPRPTPLEADTDELPSAYMTWSEFVIVAAAIKCLRKQQTDTSELMADKMAMRQLIKETAPPKDAAYPQTIVDDRWSGYDDGGEPGGWSGAIETSSIDEAEEDMDTAKLTRPTAHAIPSGAPTQVGLATLEFQKGSSVVANPATQSITVAAAGYYRLDWAGEWAVAATEAGAAIYPRINGALPGSPAAVSGPLSTTTAVVAGNSAVLQLAQGSVITLEAVHIDSGPVDLRASLVVTKVASA